MVYIFIYTDNYFVADSVSKTFFAFFSIHFIPFALEEGGGGNIEIPK